MSNNKHKKPYDNLEEEDDDLDYSTITPSLIAKATLLGDKFEPQNEAERLLKEEIAACEADGGMVDVPSDY